MKKLLALPAACMLMMAAPTADAQDNPVSPDGPPPGWTGPPPGWSGARAAV